MKKILVTLFTFYSLVVSAQVGINKVKPTSTLDNTSSVAYKIEEVTSNKILGINDHFITYTGTSTNTITLPSDANIVGRIYYVKNSSEVTVNVTATSSQTIRVGFANGAASLAIPAGQTFKFVRTANSTANAWESSRTDNPVVLTTRNVLYATQLKIPPFTLSSSQYPTYSINNWKLITITETTGDRVRGADGGSNARGRATIGFKGSKLDLTYEYQGVPFDVNKLYPIITAGNNNTTGITLIPSFARIENNTSNGRTTLRVSVARTDLYGIEAGDNDNPIQYISRWTDTNAFMNILIATQIN